MGNDYIWDNREVCDDVVMKILRDVPVWDSPSPYAQHKHTGYISWQERELLILLHKLGVRP